MANFFAPTSFVGGRRQSPEELALLEQTANSWRDHFAQRGQMQRDRRSQDIGFEEIAARERMQQEAIAAQQASQRFAADRASSDAYNARNDALSVDADPMRRKVREMGQDREANLQANLMGTQGAIQQAGAAQQAGFQEQRDQRLHGQNLETGAVQHGYGLENMAAQGGIQSGLSAQQHQQMMQQMDQQAKSARSLAELQAMAQRGNIVAQGMLQQEMQRQGAGQTMERDRAQAGFQGQRDMRQAGIGRDAADQQFQHQVLLQGQRGDQAWKQAQQEHALRGMDFGTTARQQHQAMVQAREQAGYEFTQPQREKLKSIDNQIDMLTEQIQRGRLEPEEGYKLIGLQERRRMTVLPMSRSPDRKADNQRDFDDNVVQDAHGNLVGKDSRGDWHLIAPAPRPGQVGQQPLTPEQIKAIEDDLNDGRTRITPDGKVLQPTRERADVNASSWKNWGTKDRQLFTQAVREAMEPRVIGYTTDAKGAQIEKYSEPLSLLAAQQEVAKNYDIKDHPSLRQPGNAGSGGQPQGQRLPSGGGQQGQPTDDPRMGVLEKASQQGGTTLQDQTRRRAAKIAMDVARKMQAGERLAPQDVQNYAEARRVLAQFGIAL